MGVERYAKVTCDICGREAEYRGRDTEIWERDWQTVHLVGCSHTFELCPDCSKGTYLIAVRFEGKFGRGESWLVQPSDIQALAAGVPADDVFV